MMRHIILLLLLGIFGFGHAGIAADYRYSLRWDDAHTRNLIVTLETRPQTETYTDFKIPVWRPGRYFVQDFAAAISHFEAKAPGGTLLKWERQDQNTWRVYHNNIDKVRVSYHYYADKMDAGSSYLGEEFVYFNGVNLFMYVPGRLDDDAELKVPDLPPNWKIATGLGRSSVRNVFTAKSFHELVDCPTIFAGEMKQMDFQIANTTFYIHFYGTFMGGQQVDRAILADMQKMCREQIAVFGSFPSDDFHFIYVLLPYDFRHGVEHMNSTMIFRPAKATQSVQAARSGLFGTTSHELWHVWNVKRIRPQTLLPYDYSKPQYTTLHWFTEGVTDYYANLILTRAGIRDRTEWYRILARNIQSLENSFAATQVSPSESSYNSWLSISPYRHPFRQISYYPLGARVALVLDFSIRERTGGEASLDDVFRYLYHHYFEQDRGVPEDGIQHAVEQVTGSDWKDFFDAHIHGTVPFDYKRILKDFGLEITIENSDKRNMTQIGIMDLDVIGQGWLIRQIHPGGDAYRDGLAPGDLILTVNGEKATSLSPETALGDLKRGQAIQLEVFSDQVVKDLSIRYQAAFVPKRVTISENPRAKLSQIDLREAWLKSQVPN